LAAAEAALMDSMHHNLLEVQQAVAVEETHTLQEAVAVAQVAQAEELGDKIKNIAGECMLDTVHIHQQQMKDLLLEDMEWLDKIQVHSLQQVELAD
jgi:hypothetical protein